MDPSATGGAKYRSACLFRRPTRRRFLIEEDHSDRAGQYRPNNEPPRFGTTTALINLLTFRNQIAKRAQIQSQFLVS